ncbi:MAG: hypothetical protein D6675_06800 [Gemmatimonadetes bacterium]|nr:MAG: hypothetical protein D6675_06800 [Gemmatimonadota bacterium]
MNKKETGLIQFQYECAEFREEVIFPKPDHLLSERFSLMNGAVTLHKMYQKQKSDLQLSKSLYISIL